MKELDLTGAKLLKLWLRMGYHNYQISGGEGYLYTCANVFEKWTLWGGLPVYGGILSRVRCLAFMCSLLYVLLLDTIFTRSLSR